LVGPIDRRAHEGRRADPAGVGAAAAGEGLIREWRMGTGFIARDRELAELLAGLQDAVRGRGGIFLIAGEPGIGKTALADHLARHAATQGARVLWGRSWEGGGAAPYWTWAQIIQALTEGFDEETLRSLLSPETAHMALLAPELANRFGEAATSIRVLDSDAGRFYLFEATARFLKQVSSIHPLVLILDDLLAGDRPSLLLLRFLAREVRASHVLVVATYREVEATRSPEAVEVLADLIRECRQLNLRGLDREEVGRLIAQLSGTEPWEGKVAAIHETTGGNPLFVREVTRLLATQDALDRPGRLSIPVPDSVRAVIRRRLAPLSADAVQVLSAAAVVGRDFDLTLVGAASDLPTESVLASLSDAVALGVVAEAADTGGVYRFSHPLMREAIYEGLPIAARTQMHQRVGEAIERVHGAGSTSHLGELAYHFAKSAAIGESARAGEYARRAGDRAMDSFAYEEAVVQYRRALDALALAGKPDRTVRCELLLRLGRAQARAGDYQEAKTTCLLAAEIARELGDAERLARAALGFGEPQVEGGLVDRQLVALLEEAIEGLSPEDSALRARIVARLSLELTFADDATLRETRRESLSLEAIQMARRLGDVVALCNALRARWLARWGPDGLEERSALAEEHLALARDTGDREIELLARARRITCLMEAGDGAAAVIDLAAHVRLAEELRMPYYEWVAATMRAGRAVLAGSFDRAEALAQDALARLPGRPNASHAHINQLTVLRWEQGRLGELQGAWQGLVEQYPQLGFARGWLCLADAELGREEAAREALQALVEDIPDLPRNGIWLPALALASLAAARLEEPDAAASLYPLLLPYAGRAIVISMPHPAMCFGSASFYLGLLAAEIPAWDEAESHFEAAIRANQRLDAKPFLVRTCCEYARMLIRRGRAGDRREALGLLERAAALAAPMGLPRRIERIETLRELASAEAVATEPSVAKLPAGAGKHMLRREGEYWTFLHDGSVVRLRDSKGLRCLARLLANPGQEIFAVDLEAEIEEAKPAPLVRAPAVSPAGLPMRADLGDAGELLDASAKAAYKARLDELREELQEAEGFNDPVRAATAREEMDFLARELARAVGLGGRDRKAASHAERARLNVTRAIRASLRTLARVHPSLGQHLSLTIRTGRYCSYTPDPRVPITWET
jgi:tetratricopeptide (TPR) repeat protein